MTTKATATEIRKSLDIKKDTIKEIRRILIELGLLEVEEDV